LGLLALLLLTFGQILLAGPGLAGCLLRGCGSRLPERFGVVAGAIQFSYQVADLLLQVGG
jgi:hypothetical protein